MIRRTHERSWNGKLSVRTLRAEPRPALPRFADRLFRPASRARRSARAIRAGSGHVASRCRPDRRADGPRSAFAHPILGMVQPTADRGLGTFLPGQPAGSRRDRLASSSDARANDRRPSDRGDARRVDRRHGSHPPLFDIRYAGHHRGDDRAVDPDILVRPRRHLSQ